MVESLRTRLESLIKPVVIAMGYELWGIEIHGQGKHALLQVYVDSDKGVNLDDLGRISYQLGGLLDVEDPIAHSYTLEVSSPGLDRRLFSLEHFRRFVGSMVRIKLAVGAAARRNYSGKIDAVEDDNIIIVCDGEKFKFDINQIENAKLIIN